MPELPEVETIVNGLKGKLIGQQINKIQLVEPRILRSPVKNFLDSLPGCVVKNIRRRGKMIFITLSKRIQMLIHLKMTGQLLLTSQAFPLQRHIHLILELLPSGGFLFYRDVRRFGFFCLGSEDYINDLPIVKNLGPDALTLKWPEFLEVISDSRGRIKNLLLNQNSLAGIGNIYADEILFRAKINPVQSVAKLELGQKKSLYDSIQSILKEAIEKGGSSIRDYLDSDGQQGNFQLLHQVYGRAGTPCNVCGSPIQRVKFSSRSSHFCPNCQLLHP
ncbi:MAG: bifunctional DNA-formamidopyrimidine glycosylase/DNA-(apurinic or apyrimidinic site) lyase [Candidatus Tectomicrobia bacterium]|uniref:Formamidopyrimidine-DNA glycosylase n=1 Tax=Tectimicrobiota bacterium TaxID=2528274 RepID=A0A933GMX6_UNCTE|nr:bifunctional DNA-formamidopyrimidine glycosylase/DNA-(apurinic or apyrimidinic site) lyase [Candidatus Tectomicrobia bacterium]